MSRPGEAAIRPERARHGEDLQEAAVGDAAPATLEGACVRIADRVAYLGRDMEDAILAGLISRRDVPAPVKRTLGDTNGAIIGSLVADIVTASEGRGLIGMSERVAAAAADLRRFNTERIYRLASLSKPIATWAIMIGVEEGIVELDAPLRHVRAADGATLRHLLSHASGFGFDGDEAVARIEQRRMYSNIGIERAADELAAAAEMPFEQYLREAVFTPLGMTATELRGSPAHAIRASLDDTARFVVEMLRPRLLAAETQPELVQRLGQRVRVFRETFFLGRPFVGGRAAILGGISLCVCELAGLIVVGEAENGREAVKLARQLRPDVILMDINMPALDGVQATSLIVEANPSARVIVLTMYRQDRYVFEAIKAGARGYLLKDVDEQDLVAAIRAVHQGDALINPSLAVGVISLLIALKPPALILVLTAFSWAVIASTNLWPLLFGIYWKRTSPAATVASMISGAAAALVWETVRSGLPAPWSGIHGFLVGLAVGLVVIVAGTFLGRPAPEEGVRLAWGEGESRP